MDNQLRTLCGFTRTMVHQKLVKESQYVDGEAVTIWCAHGDTVLYPLAKVEIKLEEGPIQVKAAVAEKLPASVLLGTDVPQLGKLLLCKPLALVVKTRNLGERRPRSKSGRPSSRSVESSPTI